MKHFALLAIALALLPMAVSAQDYGQRIKSLDGQWLLPVATRLLGSTDDDHVARGSINSWDLSAAPGTPVFAAAPGTVEAAGCNLYESRQWPIMQGYGCAVQIAHGDGIRSQVGHCQEGSLRVKRGDQVTAATQLCSVGMTGKTSWPHTHFTILRNGSPVRIDGLFDIRQMHYCKFCRATNKPGDPINGVAAQPTTVGRQQVAPVESQGVRLVRWLLSLPIETIGFLVWALVFGFLFLLWVGNIYIRVALFSIVCSLVAVGCAAYLFMPAPVLSQPAAGQQPASISGDAAWEWAYPIVQSNEGWACTTDGAYTMGGVTQSTYNRWRAKHGLGPADVCANLTREQAKQVYYDLFWLPSGASQMPAKLALTVVDHYINTGSVSRLLAQCGTDVACFNQARIADYRTKGNCSLYCAAWINRVNKIRRYTGG